MNKSELYNKIFELAEVEINLVKNRILSDIESDKNFCKIVAKFFNTPSKHIRSVLSFLYLKACSIETSENQILFQSAIELVHNGSLIHDDIIDEALIRREEKSLFAESGANLAVISGDLVMAYAMSYISKLKSFELLDMVIQTISKMCQGELSQQNSKYEIPDINDYIEKSYNKTGVLFETALSGSILISGKNIKYDYKNFMKNFGIAFQINDDIKNVCTDMSDVKGGVYTAPVIFSKNPDDPVSGIEKAKILSDTYIKEAEKLISDLPESKYKSAILEILEIYRYE